MGKLVTFAFGVLTGVGVMMAGLATEKIIVLNNLDGSVTIQPGTKKEENA